MSAIRTIRDNVLRFLPIAQSAIAFLLILVALIAGHKPDIMENMRVISFEISTPGLTTRQLDLSQYYSLHLTDICQGDYTENYGEPTITSCTKPFDAGAMDISALFPSSEGGPFDDEDLQDAFNLIPHVLAIPGYLLLIACIFLGVSIFATTTTTLLSSGDSIKRILIIASLAIAAVAWLMATTGAFILTIAADEVLRKVNENGNDIGIFAHSGGSALLALIWTAVVLATGTLVMLILCLRSSSAGSKSSPDTSHEKRPDMYITSTSPIADGGYPVIQGSYRPPSERASSFRSDGSGYGNVGGLGPALLLHQPVPSRSLTSSSAGGYSPPQPHYGHQDSRREEQEDDDGSDFYDDIEKHYSGEESATEETFPSSIVGRLEEINISPTRPVSFN
ncbi:hypothetical protein B0T17DRAFT_206684 [Bombardia bombarda]|uniref:SUR7/PalI family-domain-containing protein n=1 Tax=Bombardia bombarda TaxID=252184 RepID=A0AA40C937_9PEZI|nr:hypothetical protein B0T17DRAFT_206684 [Bombardia bombarda]